MQTKTTTIHQDSKDADLPYSEIRVWGVTNSGHSTLLLVRNFRPYFYVKLRNHMKPATVVTDLNAYLAQEYPSDRVPGKQFVISTEYVFKQSIMGYIPPEQATLKLLKIVMCAPRFLAKARDSLEDGVITNGYTCKTYEANVLFTMRFMVDTGISGCQWVRVPRDSYRILTAGQDRQNFRTSLVILCLDYTRLEPISTDVMGHIGPWRWLSYDIEACRYQNGFPKAEEDPITQVCFVLEEEGKGVIWKQAFCLAPPGQSCNEIYGVNLRVYATENEPQMLKDVRQFIIDTDAEFITGWNVDKFDNPYVFRDRPLAFDRQKHGHKRKDYTLYKEVSDISRDRSRLAYVKNATLNSRAFGTIKSTELVCEGRSCYDGYMHTRLREGALRLRSYGLNNTAIVVLDNDGKVDVPHWQIPILQQGTDADRAHLTHYCMVDAELPLQIMHKRMAMENGAEQARVTGIDFCQILGGEGKKTFSKLMRVMRPQNLTFPSSTPSQNDEDTSGGHVFDPKRGYYVKKPVVTCDFASLYPSIMIAYNVSYDTHCSLEWAQENLKETDYRIPPYVNKPTYCFVREHIKVGIMPQLEKELLFARAQAKKDLRAEKDPSKKKVLDARQLQLKLCANSGYGFLKGFYMNNMECMEAVTSWGRYMIELTEKVFKEHFTPEHTRHIHKIAPTAMNFIFAYMKMYPESYSQEDLQNVLWWRVSMMIHFKRDIVDEPAERIYGDSVTHDTPCLLLNVKTGARFIDTIENLIDSDWVLRGDGKYVGTASSDIRIWTDSGWTRIKQIICHRVKKKIFRVLTHTGVVDVTEDHSLLDSHANKISAVDCIVNETLLLHSYPTTSSLLGRALYSVAPRTTGEAMAWGLFMADGSCGEYECPSGKKSLWAINNTDMTFLLDAKAALDDVEESVQFKILDTLKASGVYKLVPKGEMLQLVRRYRELFYDDDCYKIVPACILNASYAIRKAFWKGYYRGDGDTRCDAKGKIGVATLYYLMRSLGYQVSINTRKDKPNIYRLTGTFDQQRKNPCRIKKIEDVTHLYNDRYVYDLETENHHFQAGIGQMIVHNTDSVMFTFGEMSNERAWYLGERASHIATCHFERPNELECEAVKQPAIFIKKKGYIVRERVYGSDKGTIKVQGETAKRRDNFLLVANLQKRCAELLLRDASDGGPDVIAAIELVHKTCRKLLMCQVDISELVLSATFSQTLEKYEEGGSKPAHVELWKKKRDRAHITGEYLESTGDRVPYVVMPVPSTNSGRCAVKKGECVEDPEYCMRHGLYPDPRWYLDQLKKPLVRLFSPVFTGDILEWVTPENRHNPLISKIFETIQTTLQGEKIRTQEHITQNIGTSKKKLAKMMAHKILFEGPHTRIRVHRSIRTEAKEQTKNNQKGGTLARFVTKGVRCLKCMTVIKGDNPISKALCKSCLPHQGVIYQQALERYSHTQELFQQAWTRCQRCQGSHVKKVVCGNRDCDNFYRRIALQVDIEDMVEKLQRFT